MLTRFDRYITDEVLPLNPEREREGARPITTGRQPGRRFCRRTNTTSSIRSVSRRDCDDGAIPYVIFWRLLPTTTSSSITRSSYLSGLNDDHFLPILRELIRSTILSGRVLRDPKRSQNLRHSQLKRNPHSLELWGHDVITTALVAEIAAHVLGKIGLAFCAALTRALLISITKDGDSNLRVVALSARLMDESKNLLNQKKHRVFFEEAATSFSRIHLKSRLTIRIIVSRAPVHFQLESLSSAGCW